MNDFANIVSYERVVCSFSNKLEKVTDETKFKLMNYADHLRAMTENDFEKAFEKAF